MKMQQLHRGSLVRAKLRTDRVAAAKIQARVRGRLQRKRMGELREASKLIQVA